MTEFAEKILNFRAEHKLTQKQFAKMCGISDVWVSHIENGYEPKLVTRVKIENVLKGSIEK